jgi:hypothetical protein
MHNIFFVVVSIVMYKEGQETGIDSITLHYLAIHVPVIGTVGMPYDLTQWYVHAFKVIMHGFNQVLFHPSFCIDIDHAVSAALS